MNDKPLTWGKSQWRKIHLMAYYYENKDSESLNQFVYNFHKHCNKIKKENFIEKAISNERKIKKMKKDQKFFDKRK